MLFNVLSNDDLEVFFDFRGMVFPVLRPVAWRAVGLALVLVTLLLFPILPAILSPVSCPPELATDLLATGLLSPSQSELRRKPVTTTRTSVLSSSIRWALSHCLSSRPLPAAQRSLSS